jgi:hypothetical protein
MVVGEQVLSSLAEATRGTGRIDAPEEWIWASAELAEDQVEHASMGLYFPESPSAYALATALLAVDREARRTATALERKLQPQALFGRGVRLVPPARGLVVENFEPGSLDVLMVLGGIYSVVTSQPLSFILNVASLLQYGRLAVRATLPEKAGDRRMEVTVASAHRHANGDTESSPNPLVLTTPAGTILVPNRYSHVTLTVESTDGSRVHFEASAIPAEG